MFSETFVSPEKGFLSCCYAHCIPTLPTTTDHRGPTTTTR